jgi:hypothetical protein
MISNTGNENDGDSDDEGWTFSLHEGFVESSDESEDGQNSSTVSLEPYPIWHTYIHTYIDHPHPVSVFYI